MADDGIVQKDEIVVVCAASRRLGRKRDRSLGLLLDCFDPCPGATVSNVAYNGRSL
jgi:hypothetical protein